MYEVSPVKPLPGCYLVKMVECHTDILFISKHSCAEIVLFISMNSVTLIFPHQLFKQHPALQKGRIVYLVEEWLFFNQYNFHQQKLILHRSGMQFYSGYLKEHGFFVEYIETSDERNDIRKLIAFLALQKINQIHIADVTDNWLIKRITSSCKEYKIQLIVYSTPSFLNTMDEVAGFFNKKKTYFQTDFYTSQLKQIRILI